MFRGLNSEISEMLPSSHNLRKSKKTVEFENVVATINKGYKELVILRGLPGSGKSFLARKILESTIGFDTNYKLHVFSTDDYFCQNSSGEFTYDVKQLDNAHKWNQSRVFQAVSRGFSPVIIDNTNTQIWEMKPYVIMASDFGYQVDILEPDTHWCFDYKELSKRNAHGVGKAKIQDMLARYERNVTPQKLLSFCKVAYTAQKQPQLRLYPPTHINVSASKAESRSCVNSLMTSQDLQQKSNYESKHTGKEINVTNGPQRHIKNEITHSLVNGYEEIMELSSDDDNELQDEAAKEIPDVETLWGISHDVLRSWDIVTPIEDCFTNCQATELVAVNDVVEKRDACFGTEDEYFRVLQRSESISNYGDLKILQTFNRNINISVPNKSLHVSKLSTLDKSCMTDDLYEDYENHISQLINLFPSVPKPHLSYWYNKCKGDLEWTIEFLLEAKEEISSLIDSDFLEPQKNISQPDSNSSILSDDKVESSTAERNEKVKKSFVENSDLKRLIESKIDIGEDHYSKHLLRIKKSKFSDQLSAGSSKMAVDPNLPSTSAQLNEISETTDDIIVIDSDMEIDELDIDDQVDDSGNKCIPFEETIEINLGDHLVNQLENTFGNLELQYPRGLQPVVQVPITLARQLYTFYIESVYQQMENQMQIMNTLTQEDEEFARKLQAKENEEMQTTKTPPVPNLKEIMTDQQIAESSAKKEADNWKKLNPDNLAAKLTRQKLFRIFPKVPQETLVEILYAHDNKYQDTIETLIASTGPDNIKGNLEAIKEPPINDDVLEEMKEAQRSNHTEEYGEVREATFYREEASKYLKKRADLYQKAQQYYQRGMTEVAQFFSGLASSQTMYFERANSLAAMAFLDEHSKRLQDFNTLDLHFLYVKEAIPSLDVFLDRNINLLRLSNTKQSEYLQIITGRGNRSEGGISRIKPAVQARLKKRNIKFVPLNPGLLKVKVTKASWVTSEIPVS
ncbi:unnamed protein product [Phaedon cochleariae]|uniref:NEDD4-binding protein 2 n=1 Tax=Phaedon cochleariae TaxID=80249 RepID=A0A9P0GQC5_PHACE|nr:unnamed protein product [Phaedon cochleariae]